MQEDKVSKEVAELEVTAWLDHKKMSAKRREEKKEAIESLISFVQEGKVTINSETFEITQHLIIEIGNQTKINKFTWKPFGNVGKIQINMKDVVSTDFTGNAIAIAMAQTGQSKNMINALDSEDGAVVKVIAIFFM